ncbi:MAG: NYN domain-containing protein [Chthoniobacterales bacterium]
MQKLLLVDGHSMIFQWPQLRELHDRKTATAREQLITLLTRYHDASDFHVAVVFDGKGSRANEQDNPGGIQIFYSAAGQTADSVIERLVAKYAKTFDLTVATDDHLERTTVESFGGNWISSESLALDLIAADDALTERLKRLRKH